MNAALVALLFLAADPTARRVPREEILAAMNACEGYDPTVTTNGARFQAEVLLRLARQAPNGPPLFLGHAEWFSAFLDRAGLTAEKAPVFMRLALEHAQDLEIDYRGDRVVESAEGPRPSFAANVTVWWPEKRGAPNSYSYEDLLSTPHLEVTNERRIVYRLLDVDGMVVYGEVDGLLGRPTSGLLGALFQVIGKGQVKESRMLISRDGLQLSRACVRQPNRAGPSHVPPYDASVEWGSPARRPTLIPCFRGISHGPVQSRTDRVVADRSPSRSPSGEQGRSGAS